MALLQEEGKIIIYGGWSNTTQHSDLFIYDIKKNEWIDPEVSHENPRWYHMGVMVPAIPSWKYFVFGGSVGNFEEGGNRTLSKFSDDAYVLDMNLANNMKNLKWTSVQLEDQKKPRAREAGALFYDSNESRLVLFGGWANNWIVEVESLSVSLITGPPYAIYSMKPSMGPLTGRTKVLIRGDGFKDSSSIVVRFLGIGKGNPIESQGQYVSETEIMCETPSFENLGPRDAEVRVSINKGDFTITSTRFCYYLNTKAEQTIAYGPGLLHDNLVGLDTIFVIQARNTKGINRESGSDNFILRITRDRLPEEYPQKAEPQEDENGEKIPVEEEQVAPYVEIHPNITDNEDGSYYVKYKLSEEFKNVKIEVSYKNERDEIVPIRGSPFLASFKSGVNPRNNDLTGIICKNMNIKLKNKFI
jgi:dynein heavy chain, axonemal